MVGQRQREYSTLILYPSKIYRAIIFWSCCIGVPCQEEENDDAVKKVSTFFTAAKKLYDKCKKEG